MSESVLTMLIWDIDMNQLTTYLMKMRSEGYLKKVSKNIIAVASKATFEEAQTVSLKASEDLRKKVLLLIYNEDIGWEVNGYHNGNELFGFSINSNRKKTLLFPINELFEFSDDKDKLVELNSILRDNEENNFIEKSWIKFISSLEVDFDNNFSYYFLMNQSENFLLSCGIREIPNQKTQPEKIQLKKILKKYLEPSMVERGFFFNSATTLPNDFAYFKIVNGVEVGLQIFKEGNSIQAVLKTLYADIPLFGNYYRHFKSTEILIDIIEEIIEAFDKEVITYHYDLMFEPFDHNELFEEYMNPYLIAKGYQIELSTINMTPNGRITFIKNNGETKIDLFHTRYYLYLFCFLKKKGEEKIIDIHDESGGVLSTPFRNKEDYISLIIQFRNVLTSMDI